MFYRIRYFTHQGRAGLVLAWSEEERDSVFRSLHNQGLAVVSSEKRSHIRVGTHNYE